VNTLVHLQRYASSFFTTATACLLCGVRTETEQVTQYRYNVTLASVRVTIFVVE